MPLTAGTASEAQTAQSQGVHSTDSSATAGSVRTKQDQSQSAHSASQEAGQKGESVIGTETASSGRSSSYRRCALGPRRHHSSCHAGILCSICTGVQAGQHENSHLKMVYIDCINARM